METTAAPNQAKQQAKARQADQQAQPIDTHKWARIIGLVVLGFVLSRFFAASPAPTMAPAPVVQQAAPQAAPVVQPIIQPIIQQAAPVIVQQPQPIIIQQPQVTIMRPAETIVIQKSYPNRTIVIETSPAVLIQ